MGVLNAILLGLPSRRYIQIGSCLGIQRAMLYLFFPDWLDWIRYGRFIS